MIRLLNILLLAFWVMGGTPKPHKWHTVPFYAVVASR
jgi:hypothetical protein